jgi:hypothetical protein
MARLAWRSKAMQDFVLDYRSRFPRDPSLLNVERFYENKLRMCRMDPEEVVELDSTHLLGTERDFYNRYEKVFPRLQFVPTKSEYKDEAVESFCDNMKPDSKIFMNKEALAKNMKQWTHPWSPPGSKSARVPAKSSTNEVLDDLNTIQMFIESISKSKNLDSYASLLRAMREMIELDESSTEDHSKYGESSLKSNFDKESDGTKELELNDVEVDVSTLSSLLPSRLSTAADEEEDDVFGSDFDDSASGLSEISAEEVDLVSSTDQPRCLQRLDEFKVDSEFREQLQKAEQEHLHDFVPSLSVYKQSKLCNETETYRLDWIARLTLT